MYNVLEMGGGGGGQVCSLQPIIQLKRRFNTRLKVTRGVWKKNKKQNYNTEGLKNNNKKKNKV